MGAVHALLDVPVQAHVAGVDHHELSVPGAVSRRHGPGPRVVGQEPRGRRAYLDFIAPGLLASTAMQIGANESMYPVMAAIKWLRTYFAMLATPLTVIDVLVGHLAWIALRLLMVTTIYLAIMAAFGTVHSAAGGPRHSRRDPHRARLRGADRGVRGGAAERHRLLDHLPLRADPAVPVLGDVLPHRAPPGLDAARRPGHPAVPRRGAVPGPGAGPRAPGPPPAPISPTWSSSPSWGSCWPGARYRRRLVT